MTPAATACTSHAIGIAWYQSAVDIQTAANSVAVNARSSGAGDAAGRPRDHQDEEDEQEPGTEPEGRDTDEGRHGAHRGPDPHHVGESAKRHALLGHTGDYPDRPPDAPIRRRRQDTVR